MRLVVLVALVAACSGSSDNKPAQSAGGQNRPAVNRDTLTQRQRDSILAQSRIPGARGVGSAMRAADSTSARVRAADTVGGP